MLKSARAILLVLVTGFSTHAHAAGCEPGPNEVALFQDSEYRGACSVLGVGNYLDSKAMRMANDSVSSIKVGANVQVEVSNHSKRGNTGHVKITGRVTENFTRSQSSLKGTRIGNDRISWVVVTLRDAPKTVKFERGDCYPGDNSTSIAIYQHPYYKGNCRVLPLGHYRNSKEMNFKHDSASSVEFGRDSKARVTLYSDGNFKGRSETLTESAPTLHDGAIGDNKLTSIKVVAGPDCDGCR